VNTDQSKPIIWLAPFSSDELCEEPGDAKTQKRRERLTDSFSWSHRDFCQEGKNTKTPGAFLDSFSWSRRDFCEEGKNKKTCIKQV